MAFPLPGRSGKSGGFAVTAGFLLASVASLIDPTGIAGVAFAQAAPPLVAPRAGTQPVGSVKSGSAASLPNPSSASSSSGSSSGGLAPPALSPSCEAPANYIAANAPLSHLAHALTEHRTLQILAVGSAALESLGENSGVKSYPVQIEDLLKVALKGVDVDVINRGTGGEVAQTSAERIRSEVTLTKPDLVLWQLGTNDALARIDAEQFTDTVKSTVDWLKANDIDVVLVGLQYTTRFAKDENYFAIKHALDRLAKDENILYIKRYDAMKFIAQTRAQVHLMASDNYHLSDLGTQCMAEHVARAMIANLFLRRFRPVGSSSVPATTSN